MASTVYEVKLAYVTNDRASAGLKAIASEADRTKFSLGGLKTILLGLGTGFAARAGYKMLVDYNSEIDQMKIGMSTVISMQMHKPFEQARKESDKLVNNLQQLAKKSPATTKDFVEMANALAPAVAMAGGGTKQLESMTAGAVTAGLATGVRPEMAALDIQQMLMGTVGMRDRMARQLLASKGVDHVAFNQMSAGKRFKMTQDLLNDPALKTAAEAFGKSFQGQLSTLKDQLQIALGKVGLPLMKALTAEFSKINTWIEKHPQELKAMITTLQHGVMNIFGYVKSVFSFIIKHKDTLMNIGKAFIVFKVAMFGKSLVNGLESAAANMAKSSTSLASRMGMVATALAALAAGAQFIADQILDSQEKRQENREKVGGVFRDVAGVRGSKFGTETDALRAENRLLHSARETGIINKKGGIDKKLLAAAVGSETGDIFGATTQRLYTQSLAALQNALEAEKKGAITSFKILQMTAAEFNQQMIGLGQHLFGVGDQMFDMFMRPFGGGHVPTPDKPKVNVTIQKIEVESPDPDRFVFGMVAAVEKIAKNPTQAQSALAGGF